MSNSPRAGGEVSGGGNDGKNNEIEKTVAKTAGFVVFSGIAMSILKALNPFNGSNESTASHKAGALTESSRIEKTQPQPLCCQPPQQPPLQEPGSQNPVTRDAEQNVVESSAKNIDIVKGDTLWGLSREHGVSIQAIKEANGLTGDTIYAGKKLIIPQ